MSELSKKLEELESQVEWFYGEEFQLDQATEKYKRATKLAKEVEKELGELKNQIEVIDKDFTKE